MSPTNRLNDCSQRTAYTPAYRLSKGVASPWPTLDRGPCARCAACSPWHSGMLASAATLGAMSSRMRFATRSKAAYPSKTLNISSVLTTTNSRHCHTIMSPRVPIRLAFLARPINLSWGGSHRPAISQINPGNRSEVRAENRVYYGISTSWDIAPN